MLNVGCDGFAGQMGLLVEMCHTGEVDDGGRLEGRSGEGSGFSCAQMIFARMT